MKFCRFRPLQDATLQPSAGLYGLLEGEEIREISGAPWGVWSRGARSWRRGEVRLLAPVEPSKLVCVGRNYAAHIAELGHETPKEPLIFLKPPSAIVGPEDPVVLTRFSKQVEHEGELAVVMARRCAHLQDADDVRPYILGYTCLNDVTARDIQKAETLFDRAKGFDTFCPIGPHIESELDPADVLVETRVNGALRQSGRTSLMLYPVFYLVRWISRMMTLNPGDVIATGTPAGVGPLLAGDVVEVSIEGIGALRNPVHAPRA
ncbi:MAG: fumarylacetoacetate hydrolase family protein [Acidobacteriia bacterium]|nr:fumarylacetoacetate hydrolase family protein [Terriglobia bacterium]